MKKILFILLLACSCFVDGFSQSQDLDKYVWYRYSYGIRYPRIQVDSVFGLPIQDTTWTPDTLGVMLIHPVSKLLYYYNGTYWAGTGTTATGSTNSNVGSAYRWAIPGTNNIKTFASGYGFSIDSVTANTLTGRIDTTHGYGVISYWYVQFLVDSLAASGVRLDNAPGGEINHVNFFSDDTYAYIKNTATDAGTFLGFDSTAYVVTYKIDTAGLRAWVGTFAETGGGDTLRVVNRGSSGITDLFARNDTLFGSRKVSAYGTVITKLSDSSLQIAADTTHGYGLMTWMNFYRIIKDSLTFGGGGGSTAAGLTGNIQFKGSNGNLSTMPNSRINFDSATASLTFAGGSLADYSGQNYSRFLFIDTSNTGSAQGGLRHHNKSGGDALIYWSIGADPASPTTAFSAGIDNSTATDNFVLTRGSIGTNPDEQITIVGGGAGRAGFGLADPPSGWKWAIARTDAASLSSPIGINLWDLYSSGNTGVGRGVFNTFRMDNGSSALEEVGRYGFTYTNVTSGSENTKFVIHSDMTSTMTELISLEGGAVQTTNATPATILTITIPDETSGVLEITLVGRESGTAGRITGVKRVAYDKNGGTLTLGTPTASLADEATGTISTATWTVTTSSNNIIIQGTGVAATTINWKTSINQIVN